MSLEPDGLVRAQGKLLGRISWAHDNLKKSGAAKTTLGILEARLGGLESNWAKFEANHQKILNSTKADEDLDYLKLGTLAKAEEAFLQQRTIFLDLLRSHKAKEREMETKETEGAKALCRAARTQIQVPTFSGKYEDWPAFRDLFSSVVIQDKTLSPVERLHFLKTSLKGEAELLIRHIPVTNANFEKSWKLVTDYYDKPRHLVRAYLDNFLAVPKLKRESAEDLRQLFHTLRSTVNSLESIGRPISSSKDLFVHLAVNLLDPQTRREWERSINDSTAPPEYAVLETFLERCLYTLEAVAANKCENAISQPVGAATKQARNHAARKAEAKPEKKSGRCALCTRDHFLLFYEEYRRKSPAEKLAVVRDRKLCVNCLGQHQASACESKKNCAACGSRHHSSVHDACRMEEVYITSQAAGGSRTRVSAVLLATARILVADRFGERHLVRALIDQGSECFMVLERLAQRLRVERAPAAVSVFGIGGNKAAMSHSCVQIDVSRRTSGPALRMKAFVLLRLTAYAGRLASPVGPWPHLLGLELADPEYAAADAVDLLFGAEVFAAIILPGLKKGAPSHPVAQNTSLGWILSGRVGDSLQNHPSRSFQCRVDDELMSLMRGFWAQEELGADRLAPSAEDEACERHFCETHSRAPDGRYRVRLPLKTSLPDFSGTRRLALRMLKQTERKFRRDAKFQEAYRDFMQQYESLGHMTVACDDANLTGRPCYLPHHGVLRESSTSTKLRVVFNGSARGSSAESLNQFLMTGANLLPALADVLLRWRRHRFAVAVDVEKMYRQIEVDPRDRDLQRILWRNDPESEIREFRLNTVTYGLSCAPFLAIRTLRRLADDDGTAWPLAAEALVKDTYMDDVLTGRPIIEAARDIRLQLTQLCRAGGFPLRKWSASDPAILDGLDDEDLLRREPLWWQPSEGHLILGLRWYPCRDEFSFVAPRLPFEIISRRSVLSLAARMFDPLGWLSPTTSLAKIWIQSSWL
ncbi:uncharacterized protein [Cardiocondyla obscurior]|uniref:uncharacterized protein n=1 Tax=Cardiocondyla obscurior TaxID=286306 RepID=UPI0039657B32